MLAIPNIPATVLNVPFYSQFKDIESLVWQKQSCGIASLAMVIGFYLPEDTTSVNTLLGQGIALGAYSQKAGWTYKGLIQVAQKHGLTGASYDLSDKTNTVALTQFKTYLKDGPVIVSVHYKFNPASNIPHLVVVDGIDGDTVYYNDPAAKSGEKQIKTADFLKAWKKRFIVIRPVKENIVAEATTGKTNSLMPLEILSM